MKTLRMILLVSAMLLCMAAPAPGQFATGWTPDPAATERFAETIPVLYGDQVRDLVAGDEHADALLYRALVPCLEEEGHADRLRVRGRWKCVRAYNQGGVGSCVGNALAAVISALNAVEVRDRGEAQAFTAMHSADGMYGLAREAAGMLRPGDGCTGAGAAEAATRLGTLYAVKYDAADLTTDRPSRAKQYGGQGVGAALKSEAARRKVGAVVRVSSAREAWALIGNGYPIVVCSSQGFKGNRDREGVIQPSGSWNHAMAIVARRTTPDGRRLFLIWNSWGDDWTGGPYWQDEPWGSFWARQDVVDGMLRRGDSFAYSDLHGFPRRSLPDFGSKHYLGKITQPEVYHGTHSWNPGDPRWDRAGVDRRGADRTTASTRAGRRIPAGRAAGP